MQKISHDFYFFHRISGPKSETREHKNVTVFKTVTFWCRRFWLFQDGIRWKKKTKSSEIVWKIKNLWNNFRIHVCEICAWKSVYNIYSSTENWFSNQNVIDKRVSTSNPQPFGDPTWWKKKGRLSEMFWKNLEFRK